MDTGAGCSDRVFGVHGVRQRNVDRVDDAETLVEVLVREGVLNPIPASHLTALGTVAADDRHELGVATRVSECRNHRHLCNVSKAHDSISDRSVCLPSPVVLRLGMRNAEFGIAYEDDCFSLWYVRMPALRASTASFGPVVAVTLKVFPLTTGILFRP